MLHRPVARRARAMRRALPATLALAALAAGACRGGSLITMNPISDAMTPATLMGCVAEAAAEAGLPVIEQRTAIAEPTLWARSAPLDAGDTTAARRVDVLTVSFRKLGRGLRVAAQTFVRRGARADGAGSAPTALRRPAARASDDRDGALWQATAPSLRVAEARDAVLARCGTLGP